MPNRTPEWTGATRRIRTDDLLITNDMPRFRTSQRIGSGYGKYWCRGRDSNPHGVFTPEDFKSCFRQTPSVTMGHIPRERERLFGGLPCMVTHENRSSPIEQAKFRPSGRLTPE